MLAVRLEPPRDRTSLLRFSPIQPRRARGRRFRPERRRLRGRRARFLVCPQESFSLCCVSAGIICNSAIREQTKQSNGRLNRSSKRREGNHLVRTPIIRPLSKSFARSFRLGTSFAVWRRRQEKSSACVATSCLWSKGQRCSFYRSASGENHSASRVVVGGPATRKSGPEKYRATRIALPGRSELKSAQPQDRMAAEAALLLS